MVRPLSLTLLRARRAMRHLMSLAPKVVLSKAANMQLREDRTGDTIAEDPVEEEEAALVVVRATKKARGRKVWRVTSVEAPSVADHSGADADTMAAAEGDVDVVDTAEPLARKEKSVNRTAK